MRILERYIIRSVIAIFLATIFIFCFLYIIIDITSNLDEIIGRKVPFVILLKYYGSFLPIILVQTSPIACLISILFTFSSMSNNNEITAIRTSGLNFWRITKPAIVFGLLISCLIFWLNECFVPQATSASNKIRTENLILETDKAKKKKSPVKNLTFYGFKNRLYFIDSFNPNTNEMEGITIIGLDQEQNVTEKVVAYKGLWTGIASWKFYNCQITTYNPHDIKSTINFKVYDEKLMDIKETPEDFLKQRMEISSMNIKELHAYIEKFSTSGAVKALNNLRVDLHQKISYPFGNLVIILLGLPFAMKIKNRKGTTFTSLGIAVAIGFLYYVANAVSLNLFGKGGLLVPLAAAWLTPLFFTLTALFLIKKIF